MTATRTKTKPNCIITGVHDANSIAWLWDEEDIDLAWKLHLEECLEEDHCDCYCDNGSSIRLYGSWKSSKGIFTPSRTGEFSAIFNPDSNTLQVLRSNYVIRCNHCSPCFPGQGDVDSDGEIWAYCLPPDYMDEKWILENGHRVYQRMKSRRGNYYWKKWQ